VFSSNALTPDTCSFLKAYAVNQKEGPDILGSSTTVIYTQAKIDNSLLKTGSSGPFQSYLVLPEKLFVST